MSLLKEICPKKEQESIFNGTHPEILQFITKKNSASPFAPFIRTITGDNEETPSDALPGPIPNFRPSSNEIRSPDNTMPLASKCLQTFSCESVPISSGQGDEPSFEENMCLNQQRPSLGTPISIRKERAAIASSAKFEKRIPPSEIFIQTENSPKLVTPIPIRPAAFDEAPPNTPSSVFMSTSIKPSPLQHILSQKISHYSTPIERSRVSSIDSSLSITGDFGLDAPISATQRKSRIRFSDEETENLIHGYKKYGNQWAVILSHYKFHQMRRAGDLKDKIRNLKRADLI